EQNATARRRVAASANRGSGGTWHTHYQIRRTDISLDDWRNLRLRRDRRRHAMKQTAPAHFGKHQQIEKMHAAQNEQDDPDLAAQKLKHFSQIGWGAGLFQSERDVADVNQIESDDEQMVNRVG